MIRKPPAKKQKKTDKSLDWVVVVKDGVINAAINNHVDTISKLKKLGYTILGYPAFERKIDAITWVEEYTGKYYKRERKK
jgi:hypothetical protein